jgi:putative ABC transport system permease protein
MLKHQLILIYRNFKRYKSSFFINLIGLSTGLSCALLIYLWVNDEMKMDHFHNDRLYQVMENENMTDGINTVDGTPGVLAEAIEKEMPEVEAAVTVSPTYWLGQSSVSANHKPAVKAAGKFAGTNFFKIFSYPLLIGKTDQVLKDKNTVVISEGLALKLFGSTDVIGKEFVWTNTDIKNEKHALISGVFKNIPTNSSDQFDFLVSLDALFTTASNYLKWGNYGPNTFFILKAGANPEHFNAKIKDFLKTKGQNDHTLFIRPFAENYLYNRFENGKVAGGRIDYVKLFSLIAVFILLIACINFMNLSTAKASRRLKEVGVKKVLGAQRSSLIWQYLAESMLLTIMALFLSLLVVELLLPQFNAIVSKQLSLHYSVSLVLSLLGIIVFTGLISGSYPAFYLSGLKPALALKGKLNLTQGALWTRQGLVIFQFTLSVILIVAVLVIYKQIVYVQHKNQGYQKDNVLYFETAGKFKNNINFAINELAKIPGVINASSIDRELLGDLNYTFGDFSWEGRDPKEVIKFQMASVNNNLIETLGIKMDAGRSFSDGFGADTSKIILNQAGIKAMRLANPVGKIFNLWGRDYQIIGVIKDFHFESLHQTVKPMLFKYAPNKTNRVMLNVKTGKIKDVIEEIQKINATYNPGVNLDIKFLDQDFQAQYAAENRIAVLSRYFAAIAVLISCLGLFGLATFTAERRLKEIGIRKVLGASAWNVVYTLSKDFTKPVVTAIVIALPISYVLTQYWLNTFAYRIELRFWYFLFAGLLALFISLLTVLMQALKAARVNPVECLKTD